MSHESVPTVSELRWRCRRGMLELDIMLNAYLDARGGKISGQELKVFEKLLAYPDQVLQGLMIGDAETTDDEIAGLIARIREVVVQQRNMAVQCNRSFQAVIPSPMNKRYGWSPVNEQEIKHADDTK